MSVDFKKWNEQFGGEAAKKAMADAKENSGTYDELPEDTYICKLEKLELGESNKHKPMVKGMFRIIQGKHKKQCIFYNGVMAANDPSKSGYCIHNVLNFLRDLGVFDDSEIDFDGNFETFNDLLLDIAEEAESMTFEVTTEKDGDFTRLSVCEA